jgi:hypothetical protein
MYRCAACGKEIELPEDPETDRRMEHGGTVRLRCACRQEGSLDIVVGLEEGWDWIEEKTIYYVWSKDYAGKPPLGMIGDFVV